MYEIHSLSLCFMKNTKAFSLIEMVVVITILAILSLIGFVSFSDNIIGARDSERTNDMEKLQIDLKSHKQKEGSYPLPVNPINITNSGTVIYQGLLTSATVSNVLTNVPKDPRTGNWYWYSTLTNRQQFQVALTLEGADTPTALVKGDYKSIAKDMFPTILLAVTGSISFSVTDNASKFILNGGSYNLPYDMEGVMVSSGSSFSEITLESGVVIESSGNYASCSEIYEAGRSMGSGTYQIVNDGGTLTGTGCPMDY